MTAIKKTGDLLHRYHIKGIYLLIVLYIIVTCVNGAFLSWSNWMNLLRQVSVYGIMACGITFVMLTGRTELSAGMMISLLCELSCWFAIEKGVGNQALAIIMPIVFGALFGLINGVLVGVIRLNSFVATMGTMSVFMGLGLLFYNSADQLWASQDNAFYWFLGNGSLLGIPVPVLICAAAAIVCAVVLKKTVFGQRVYAVGGNIVNARFSGINPALIIVLVYVISGALTGLASVVMTARIMGINTKMGAGYEFTCLTAIVLGGLHIKGGKGNVGGAIIGVLILGILANSFTVMGVNPYLQYVIQGIILAAAVSVQMAGERRAKL